MNNERLCDHTLFMRSILVLFLVASKAIQLACFSAWRPRLTLCPLSAGSKFLEKEVRKHQKRAKQRKDAGGENKTTRDDL